MAFFYYMQAWPIIFVYSSCSMGQWWILFPLLQDYESIYPSDWRNWACCLTRNWFIWFTGQRFSTTRSRAQNVEAHRREFPKPTKGTLNNNWYYICFILFFTLLINSNKVSLFCCFLFFKKLVYISKYDLKSYLTGSSMVFYTKKKLFTIFDDLLFIVLIKSTYL